MKILGEKNVTSMDAEAGENPALLEAGLFAFIKQRPLASQDPTVTSTGSSSPHSIPIRGSGFQVHALKGEEANFQTGLDALAKLAKTYLNIGVKQNAAALTQAKNVTITTKTGPNLAGNVSVQINHLDPGPPATGMDY